MTISSLAASVRAGGVTASELVMGSLKRIEEFNPALNAVVALREEALDDADLADAGRPTGALAGLPLLVKDTEDVAGMRTTHGSVVHASDPPATSDSLVVARLRDAGAIVVGKTNTPEFAFEGYTHNVLFGATGNPWMPDLSPGGSSGGSAAALVAGMAPLATGSDGGGSVRIPAAFCGLAGLKPTNGLIGRSPIPSWVDLSTSGPMATNVTDLALLLGVMKGPVAGDPTAHPAWSPRMGVWPRRALVAERLGRDGGLSPGVGTTFQASLVLFAHATGLSPEPADLTAVLDVGDPDEDWFTICAVEELHAFGRDRLAAQGDELSPVFRTIMELASRVDFDTYLDAKRRRFAYVRAFDELLGDDTVLLSPTMCIEGLPADGVMPGADHAGTPSDVYNTELANITGHPALSVPAGISSNGLPFGLQIVGPRFADDLVLAVGATWEAASPWALTAPGYRPFGA
jgi:amidase/aspartyl-tRNA(Asn)/glutamyl-tRNA(Gln) amidotransferase subunit A